MKYCEKCGNKLEEGYAFCNKCGAKVELKETKKHEDEEEKKDKEEKIERKEKAEKVEKVEKVERPVPPEYPPFPPRPPRRPGRGKIIFLTILNVILLATTSTFLVLWLTKSTDKECNNTNNYSGSGNTEIDKPTKNDSKYIGKWEQNVEYKNKNNSKVIKKTYGMIELKDDGTFRSVFYDKDDVIDTKEEIEGTYKISGTKVKFEWKSSGVKDSLELTIKNDKMCLDTSCDNYLVKNSYNNKITIYSDEPAKEEIETINYSQYEQLQIDYKDAIVVVVREGCSCCEKFEPVVEQIADEYTTPVYYYQNDGKISISGTPTTIIIKNGYVVGSVEGYKELSDMEETLDGLGVK